MTPELAAIIVAAIAGIPTSLAVVISLLNRREVKPGGELRERIETVAQEFSAPDANGNTLREEVQQIERILTEHVRQIEVALQQLGMSQDEAVDWLADLRRRDTERRAREIESEGDG